MSHSPAPDLVVIGNLIVDDVELPDGTTRLGCAGGATLYAALGASLWGVTVGLVSRLGDDYPRAALQALSERRVDLAGALALGRPGGRSWLRYRGGLRTIEPQPDRPSHLAISPAFDELPKQYLRARHVHVAPMPFAAQAALVEHLATLPGVRISLDPHLPLAPDTLAGWRRLLRAVDVLLVGLDEVRMPEAREGWIRELACSVGGRLAQVLAKRGAEGGVVYDVATDREQAWAAAPWPVVDPTGAGDSFAGGFASGLLAGEPVTSCLHRGLVSASFALGDWGPDGLLRATPERARARLVELASAARS